MICFSTISRRRVSTTFEMSSSEDMVPCWLFDMPKIAGAGCGSRGGRAERLTPLQREAMEEATAKALSELLLRHGGEKNDILFLVQADEPPEEFARICAMIGQTMGSIWADALRPIFAEHPRLKPEGLE